MAKSKKKEETRTSIDDLNDSIVSVGSKIKENKKTIAFVTCLVAALVIGVCVYIFAFRNPRIAAGNDRVGALSVQYMQNPQDSTVIANLEAEALKNSDKSGDQARLLAAYGYYNEGKYDKAVELLNDYSAHDNIVAAAAYSLKGDCFANLEKYDDAVKAFQEAVDASDDNANYTPFFMLKIARIYNVQGKYADELAVLEEINEKYPTYALEGNDAYVDINTEFSKQLETARLRAGKK